MRVRVFSIGKADRFKIAILGDSSSRDDTRSLANRSTLEFSEATYPHNSASNSARSLSFPLTFRPGRF